MKNILFGSVVAAALIFSGCGSSSSSSSTTGSTDGNTSTGGTDGNTSTGGTDGNTSTGGTDGNTSTTPVVLGVITELAAFTEGSKDWKVFSDVTKDDQNVTTNNASQTWQQAKDYCENLPTGWSLPTKEEVLSLVDGNVTDATNDEVIDYDNLKASVGTKLDNTKPYLWLAESSSTHAWILYVDAKKVQTYEKKDNKAHIICVK